MSMINVTFKKFSGAGNDFILIDKKDFPKLNLSPNQIQKICDRRRGVGADGVLLIDDLEGFDFSMKYYNSDGSLGSLCGNGARCAIKYAKLSGRISEHTFFECNNEKFKGEIIDEKNVRFYFNNPTRIKKEFKLKLKNQLIKASFADTGSPHVVIRIDDVLQNPDKSDSYYKNISDFPVYDFGVEIRYHNDFQPEGVNVNFIKIDGNEISIRTYERGVENETLACGTGSTAAAILASLKYDLQPPVEIKTFGGDSLIVDFDNKNGIQNVSLTGPAELVFTGQYFL